MEKDIEEVKKIAPEVKSNLEALDKDNLANRGKQGCEKGTGVDRSRTSMTAQVIAIVTLSYLHFREFAFNLSTTIVGCGIMSIPATLKILGICPAFFLIAFVAFLCDKSAQFMLRYTSYGKSATYVELMTESFGKIGSVLLQLCIMFNNFGGLVIYLMIIGDVVSGNGSESKSVGILVEWFGEEWWNSRKVTLFVTLVLVLLPLVLFKQIVHPVHAELAVTSDMKVAVRISLVLYAIIYSTSGFSRYLPFGDSTMSDILSNFDHESSHSKYGPMLNDIVRISYALHLILVFPLLNFSLRLNIDEMFSSRRPLKADNTRFVITTVVLMAFVYIATITIPNIWVLFQFIGSTASVCMSLIFPGAIVRLLVLENLQLLLS